MGSETRTFALSTFGCKVNQYEGQAIRELMTDLGWREVPFRAVAALYIVNTCTVTSRADEKCRKAVRRAIRSNPAARVIVTGCAARTSPEQFRRISGVSAVLTREQMVHVGRFLENGDIPPAGSVFGLRIRRFSGHTRAFLKIQDGCEAHCSYCIVPRARGPVRSRPLEDIREEAERLVASGHVEVVLAGIHLGHYGRDMNRRVGLFDAVREVLAIRGLQRLRLSSIEVGELGDDLLSLGASDDRLCPHFHLPLQSGDEEVLAAMGRRYTAAEFLGTVERIRRRLHHPSLTTDVMVGFPRETDAQFDHTLDVCRQAGFSRIHIFPFSPRAGTRAADFANPVPTDIVRQREEKLKAVASELALAYKRLFLGRTVRPLVEHRRDRDTGLLAGWTERYLRVAFPGPDSLMGRIVPVRAAQASADRILAIGE